MKNPDQGLPIRDRRSKNKVRTYPNCFVGSEFVDWILRQKIAIRSRVEAVTLGNRLVSKGWIEALNAQVFKDSEWCFYGFTSKSENDVKRDEAEDEGGLEETRSSLSSAGDELGVSDFEILQTIGRGR